MNKKRKLVDSKIIFLFGTGVIIVFSLLFHKAEQLKSMFEVVQPDRISITYLQLLVEMDPNDNSSRLALARQQVAIGNINDARQVLKPFLTSNEKLATEGKLLNLELDLKDYFAKSSLDNTKTADLAVLQEKISAIANGDLSKILIPKVIEKSLSLNKPEIAALLYERLAKQDSTKSFQHLQEAGRWYIAAGKPLLAATMYHNAFTSTSDTDAAKKYALLAINATRAADKGQLGLDYIKEFRSRFPNDQDLINEGIALSLATNDPKQAFELGQSRLSRDLDNPEKINKQVELALAVGKLGDALSLSEKLLTLKPLDLETRRRTAQIAEWYGKLDIAFKHWAHLLSQGDSDIKTEENFYRLANSTKNSSYIISGLSGVINKRPLTDRELNLILESSSKKADANQFSVFLNNYLKKQPANQNAWIAYAKTQINAEKFDTALETLNQISKIFKKDINIPILEANLLVKTKQPEKAFQRLLFAKKLAKPEDFTYWQSLADMSWQQKSKANALEAYKTLWLYKKDNVLVAERLIQLFRENNQCAEGIATAKAAYQQFNDSRWLLLAMDTAAQFKSWHDLRESLQVANTKQQQFKKLEMYWLLRAQLSNHNQQPYLALSEYKEVLKINPNSKIAKDGIMWGLIGQQDKVNARINLASNSLRKIITQ